MRRLCIVLLALGASTPAQASDLAEALNFAQSVMGDEIIEGFEDFVDYDPTEALPLLLARDLRETSTPHEPLYQEGATRRKSRPHFTDLGKQRLNYAALRPYVERAARETQLPVALIDAVIRTESGYRPRAVSRSGAKGLMQLMPATARSVGVYDPFDPAQNIMGGARYLRKLYDRFGTLRLAVAAYNAGPGNVRKHKGVPPFKETRRYVQAVLTRYQSSPLR